MLSEPGPLLVFGPGESKHLVFTACLKVCMPDQRWYYVYMMQSSSRRALYIGVTSNLEQRVWQHKMGMIDGFTAQYNAHRLVLVERFSTVQFAIAREKQLKGWTRAKKNRLVEMTNPAWKDLAADWFKEKSRTAAAGE